MQGASLEAWFQLFCVIHKHSTSQLLRQLLIMSKTVLPQSSSLLHLITPQSFLFKGHPILCSIVSPHTLPPSLDKSLSFSQTGATLPTPWSAPSGLPRPAPAISREGFLPASWLLLFSTSYLSFYYLWGISDPSTANTCTRSYHRIQDGAQNSPVTVYRWEETNKKGDKPWGWLFFHFIQLWMNISTKITQIK